MTVAVMLVGALPLVLPAASANAGEITTFAGGPGSFEPVPATSVAQRPSGIASVTTPTGRTLYVADDRHHVVRAIDIGTTGEAVERIVAGTGVAGFVGDGGKANSANLDSPSAVAVDPRDGTLYIADTANFRVRQVVDGNITTVAGNGELPDVAMDGPNARQAPLGPPVGIAVDPRDGSLYIATNPKGETAAIYGQSRAVRKVGPPVPNAGDRPMTTVTNLVEGPWGMAVDSGGTPYVVDRPTVPPGGAVSIAQSRILRLTQNPPLVWAGVRQRNTTQVQCTPSPDGSALTDTLCGVTGIAIGPDDGDVYFTETDGHRVRRIVADGPDDQGRRVETVAGVGVEGFSGDGAAAALAQLDAPTGLAFGAPSPGSGPILYISDTGNHRVRHVVSGKVDTLAGTGRCCDGGDDREATRAQLQRPAGVAIDPNTGDAYIADTLNHRVRRVDHATRVITTVAGGPMPGPAPPVGAGPGDDGPARQAVLSSPMGTAVDATGSLYIADTGHNRVRKVVPGPDGMVNGGAGEIITTLAGNGTGATPSTRPVTLECPSPADPTCDVLDPENDGVTAGAPAQTTDGVKATDTNLGAPRSVTVDPSDSSVYIADTANHRVRRVDPAGIITTIAGTGVPAGTGDDRAAASAQLNQPSGVVVDTEGWLFVADTGNGRVRRLGPPEPVAPGEDPSVPPATAVPERIITTLADGLAAPSALALDEAGTFIYVSETGDHRVQRIDTATKVVSGVVGTGTPGLGGDGGPPETARLRSPSGVTVNGNVLLVADTENDRVRRVTLGAVDQGGGDEGGQVGPPTCVVPPPTFALPRGSSGAETATGQWSSTGPLCIPRQGHTASRLGDGRVLAAGGSPLAYSVVEALSSAEVYDPEEGTWVLTGSLAEARSGHTATVLDGAPCEGPIPAQWCGMVLVTGGLAESRTGALASAELYDPKAGLWRSTRSTGQPMSMGGARSGHTATLLPNGRVLVAGGGAAAAEVFNPNDGTFNPTMPMASTRSGHTATLLDAPECQPSVRPSWCGKVLVAGGGPAAGELFDPTIGNGVWRPTGAMSTSRSDHVAAGLGNGSVLVAGGLLYPSGLDNTPSGLRSAEVFEPATETWRPTGPMQEERAGENYHFHFTFTATVMPTGQVLVAGGGRDSAALSPDTVTRSTEIYDPAGRASPVESESNPGTDLVGAFRPAGDLVAGRWDHTATLLTDGKVLVAGGADHPNGNFTAMASAELFDPNAPLPPPSITGISPTGGPSRGGTKVVITGVNFGGAGSPLFGGVPAPWFLVESPTRIVASSPPHEPGPVEVQVETPAGKTAKNVGVNRFTYGTWTPTASLATPRTEHRSTLLDDGSVLVTGGHQNNQGKAATVLGSTERYQPVTGRWERNSGLLLARYGHSATTFGGLPCSGSPPPKWCGQVLVAGGIGGGGRPMGSAELYDPGPGEWSAATAMVQPRSGHTATALLDGSVLVAGGSDPKGEPSVAQRYLPAQGTWVLAGRLRTPRVGHATTILDDGTVVVAGGTDLAGRTLASVERFDPKAEPAQAWTVASPMAHARTGHSLTLLADGRVLAAGGGPLAAEIYDAGADGWATTASLGEGRSGHGATILSTRPCAERCDRVLIAGGEGTTGTPFATAELYDPIRGTWDPTEILVTARSGHTVTPLADGGVLAVGGSAADGTPLGGAEVYLPAERDPLVGVLDPSAGPTFGGTAVRITGTGMSGDDIEVHFGDLPATAVTFASDTEVVAVSPPQPKGTVMVRVSVRGNDSPGSPAARFTYGAGSWAPTTPRPDLRPVPLADDEEDARAFGARLPEGSHRNYGHTATRLDGPACRRPAPSSWCGQILVAGGRTGRAGGGARSIAGALLYDPATSQWSASASMAQARVGHTANLLDGPQCKAGAPPPWCGRVLVVGGAMSMDQVRNDSTVGPDNRFAEVYDPESRRWTATSLMQAARVWHTATSLADGRVLVAGGSDDVVALDGNVVAAEVYDPASGGWSRTGDMTAGRALHSATLLADGNVLLAGGLGPRPDLVTNGPTLESTELFDPVAGGTYVGELGSESAPGAFRRADSLAEGRFAHTATSLDGPGCGASGAPAWCGTVLIVGGVVSREREVDQSEPLVYLASAESYDRTAPAGARWSSAGQLRLSRAGHSATSLPNGTVLVAGRGTPIHDEEGPAASSTAEIYEPLSRRWSYTGPMLAPRGLHSATLLDGPGCMGADPAAWCGTVLAVGGASNAIEPYWFDPGLATAEIYTPTPTVTKLTPSQGPPGTEVVIEGTGFSATAVPSFGDITLAPGSFRVDSPTRITATAPSHPGGSVDVAVSNPAGSSATMAPNPGARFRFFGLASGVDDLVATVVSDTEVSLSFSAPADAAGRPATRYVIKVANGSIDTDEAFETARTICVPSCRPDPGPGRAGDAVVFSVAGLRPGTDYAFSLRPLTEAGPGPRSNTALARTTGIAQKICAALPDPGVNQVAYPEGYSLVGGPSSTRLMANGPLYSWFDQGAGSTYATSAADQALTAGRGYWAWFSCPALVNLAGPGPDQVEMPLGAYHASMVANPSANAEATLTGHDFAAAWDPEANDGAGGYHISGYRAPQRLAVGEGTWVFSYEKTVVRLSAR